MQIISNYRCPDCFYEYDFFAWDENLWIEPMTNFEDLENFVCPTCGTKKENFSYVEEYINEISDIDNLLFEEEIHVPFYRFENWNLLVSVWIDDNFHPMEEEHYIKYVWLFDDNWDAVLIKTHSKIEDTEEIIFAENEISNLDFKEIRVACNIHWVWKREIENIL